MRPTTDLGALASALHSDVYGDDDAHQERPCRCPWWSPDVAEAQRLISELGRLGWHVAADVSLPTSAPKGDPKTAAEQIEDLERRHHDVWWELHAYGKQSAEEIHGALRTHGNPQSEASVRSRLVELERAGHVRRVEGMKRRTRNGGWGQVWAARRSAMNVAA